MESALKDYELREKVYLMPLKKRVIELFRVFPKNVRYMNLIKESLISDEGLYRKHGINTLLFDPGNYIFIDHDKLGIFTMYYHRESGPHFSFSFEPFHGIRTQRSAFVDSSEAKLVYTAAISYYMSHGKDSAGMPLIVNIFPELAKQALEGTICAEY